MPAQKGIAKKQAQKLAESLSCYTPNDWPKTIDCLRNVPEKNITSVASKFVSNLRNLLRIENSPLTFGVRSISQIQYSHQLLNPNGQVLLWPKIHVMWSLKSQQKFHCSPVSIMMMVQWNRHVRNIFILSEWRIHFPNKNQKFHEVNWINRILLIVALLNDPVFYEKYTSNLVDALSNTLYFDHHERPIQESITNRIVEFYFNGQVTKEKETNLTNVTKFFKICKRGVGEFIASHLFL